MIRKLLSMMAVSLLMVIMAFSGSVFAQPVSIETGALENTGDSVLFPYYDIRTVAQGGPGLSDNYFAVANTEGDDWVQAHVRVRTGQCSVELLDFDVILSPKDVFTFDLYQGSSGNTVFASCDTHTLVASGFNVDSNGCFVLDSATFPQMLSLIKTCGTCPSGSAISDIDALAATRFGYVEAIGEIVLQPVTFGNCSGAPADTRGCDICAKAQLVAGQYTAWSWVDGDDCPVHSVFNSLFGRLYQAKFDAQRNVVALATSNGLSLDHSVQGSGTEPWILHRPCYSDASSGCSTGDGELENSNPFVTAGAKFAYNKLYESNQTALNGATDINYCFWGKETGDEPVADNLGVNRVGAAATFGPTLADLRNTAGPRDGTAIRTEDIIVSLNNMIAKQFMVSHYFFIPGIGQTRYVFTFPFQHFINEQIGITKDVRLDTEENGCVIPTGKFISPGLPPSVSPQGELTILDTQGATDACTFNEGWLAFTLEVTKVGPTTSVHPSFITPSLPGVIGTVTNSSSSVLSTAPMQWSDNDHWNEKN